MIHSRGHGRSTRDGRPYSDELLASDVLAVMNALHLDPDKSRWVGATARAPHCLLQRNTPHALQVTSSLPGTWTRPALDLLKPLKHGTVVSRATLRTTSSFHATPEQFEHFVEDVGLMQRTQPNYSCAGSCEHKCAR